MPLPNAGMSFTPFDSLPASDLNDLVENIEALSDGTGIDALSEAVTAIHKPYKFSVYRNAAWNKANGDTKILFDAELYDSNNNFDSTTNNRYTAPVAGFYHFDARTEWAVNADAQEFNLQIRKNGVYLKGGSKSQTSTNTGTVAPIISADIQLAASDYVEIFGGWGSGLVSGTTGHENTYFSGHLISKT